MKSQRKLHNCGCGVRTLLCAAAGSSERVAAAGASETVSCHPKGALHGHWVLWALWDLCHRCELWGLLLDPSEGVCAGWAMVLP